MNDKIEIGDDITAYLELLIKKLHDGGITQKEFEDLYAHIKRKRDMIVSDPNNQTTNF